MRLWVKLKNNPTITKNISDKDFDEKTMIKIENNNDSSKLDEIIKERKAPGISTTSSRNQEPSLSFNGKIDEGAVGNYLDAKLESAKERAVDRNNKNKSSFKPSKVTIGRKKL